MTKGGKQPGAGRPPAPARPSPLSWRPQTQAQADKYKLLGGSRWLRHQIDAADPYPAKREAKK